MIHLHIICEGITEAAFAKAMLAPHFAQTGIMLHPARIGSAGRKGGNITYDRLQKDISNRLLGHRDAYCTTFIDYYGLPADFPGKRDAAQKQSLDEKQATVCRELAAQLSARLGEDVMRRFMPYVQMHEFEALLFSDTAATATAVAQPGIERALGRIRDGFDTPEHIDDDPATAPSKRITELFPSDDPYEKVIMGSLAALEIGLAAMRAQCPLFDAWIHTLESLAA